MRRLSALLEMPLNYSLFIDLIGGNGRETYVREYVCAQPGQRVLDIGCGTADILRYLPPVEYQGFDLNAAYIKSAQRRHGSRGSFFCADVTQAVLADPGSFDVVMANGVLHHLDNETARCLLRLAHQALKPGGRLCFIDPCYLPQQSRFTRYLLGMDRGKYIGTPERYVKLGQEVFSDLTWHIREDLLRVPYSHCILNAIKSSSAQPVSTGAEIISQT